MLGKPERQCAADALAGAGDEGAAAGEVKKRKGHEAAFILGGQLEKHSTRCYFEAWWNAFQTGWFTKAARKARISDSELLKAIRQVAEGKADDPGGVWRSTWQKALSTRAMRSRRFTRPWRLCMK
ncbi:type II toxin-antitoxin system RelE/ParE family toxin [Rhizobium leguminosarum]|uniref:type II toxin-antitoxin system RelE/ParE family toxin n=1 Tax=Rhizobium leguminosarum TaxID=384 RepID=UPI003F944288